MANWIYVENNEVVEQHDLLPKNWKHVSGLDLSADDLPFLKSLGWYPVTKQETSYDSNTQYVSEYSYTIRENDVLETEVIDTQKESTLDTLTLKRNFCIQLRNERNKRLQQSDWTQLPDVQSTFNQELKNKWLIYRQALRDITQTYSQNDIIMLDQVVWPNLPQ